MSRPGTIGSRYVVLAKPRYACADFTHCRLILLPTDSPLIDDTLCGWHVTPSTRYWSSQAGQKKKSSARCTICRQSTRTAPVSRTIMTEVEDRRRAYWKLRMVIKSVSHNTLAKLQALGFTHIFRVVHVANFPQDKHSPSNTTPHPRFNRSNPRSDSTTNKHKPSRWPLHLTSTPPSSNTHDTSVSQKTHPPQRQSPTSSRAG